MIYTCKWGTCGKIFNNLDNFIEHFKNKHLTDGENCLWEGCNGFKFNDEDTSQRINHIRAHVGEVPFSCNHPNCKKSYKKIEGLLKHITTHKEDTPIPEKSTKSNKQFKSKRNLSTQLREATETETTSNKRIRVKEVHSPESKVSPTTDSNIDSPSHIKELSSTDRDKNSEPFKSPPSIPTPKEELRVKKRKKKASTDRNSLSHDLSKENSHQNSKQTPTTSRKSSKNKVTEEQKGSILNEEVLTKLTKVLETRIAIVLESINCIEENIFKNNDTELKLKLENQLLVDSLGESEFK
ncbi:Sex-determining transformer protein 1 [Smittium mucronatum]|uniref:Sex-determining transformer protein 1 n=1 Tax=Smittium mucronatum TaxID=133383 RepID=A0A1R0H3I4_9FUNG|nr:Sex-determining transformer protein 1 [Smittium mucronatum]